MQDIGVYIHIPFCTHRCCYCDFNTYSKHEYLIPDYVKALCREVELISRVYRNTYSIKSIYFGGGTPSLLKFHHVDSIIKTISQNFQIEPFAEITLEANPGSITPDLLTVANKAGVNRLSIGMQSANPFDLRLLERHHDFFNVINAVKLARQAGFHNISLDLIFGIPGQSLSSWQHSLEMAVGLKPDHISAYSLTLEGKTRLVRWVERGLLNISDPDDGADMYEWCSNFLFSSGYYHYEISNWARINMKGEKLMSKHNIQYWKNLPYLGIGAGAHSYINNKRMVNVLSPKSYIQHILHLNDIVPKTEYYDVKEELITHPSPAVMEIVDVNKKIEMSETMIMGLRLINDGVQESEFLDRFGTSLKAVYGFEIDKLVKKRLLEWFNEHSAIRLTPKGRLLANSIFLEFVGAS